MAAIKQKALIVDDEESLREVLAFELEDIGFECLFAENGKEAIDVLKASAGVSLVISDVRMAGGSGLELARQISESLRPKPVVVLVSGFLELNDEQHGELGVDATFNKPIDFDAFAHYIRDVFHISS